MKEFYKYFKVNDKIRDLEFNKDYLNIFSKDVLKQIKNSTPGWEDKLPDGVSEMIIKKKMFGYKSLIKNLISVLFCFNLINNSFNNSFFINYKCCSKNTFILISSKLLLSPNSKSLNQLF